MKQRERFVMVGVSGGWRIQNTKTGRFWGNIFRSQPYDLKDALNNRESNSEILNKLVKKYT